MSGFLFDMPNGGDPRVRAGKRARRAEGTGVPARPRYERAERLRVTCMPMHLDALVREDDPVRDVWTYVENADLSRLHEQCRAVEGGPGRAAVDPQILLTLWVQATVDGVGAARALARLCEEHSVYRWICGGVTVSYHTLSSFRAEHEDLLDALLTDSVTALQKEGLVVIERVAHDGLKIRASAGAASFRRERTLEELWDETAAHVKRLRAELDEDPCEGLGKRAAARRRALEERRARIEGAREQIKALKASRDANAKKEARASVTDPEARVMKMPDGGFRPAYNAQITSDTATQVVLSVEVTQSGSDMGQLEPLVERIVEQYGVAPREVLVDGGYANHAAITAVTADHGCAVYAPVAKHTQGGRDPHEPKATDSPEIAEWRTRMGTDAAKTIYKQRAATAECVNAIARNRGLRFLHMRGLRKARTEVLLFALTHNIMRTITLRKSAQAAAQKALAAA